MTAGTPQRQARIWFSLGGTLLGLVLLTIPFRIWPLDLSIGDAFYEPGLGWIQGKGKAWLWDVLYQSGTFPALLVVLAAIAVLVLGFRDRTWAKWRKVSTYLVLCLAMGPGLVVNAIFKDHWGRPRPNEVQAFGGVYAFEPVWTIDASSPGKSFPCGHCSMGFFFFGVALLLKKRRTLGMGLAAVFGVLIGMARVAQGGHFMSDVLWAGGFCLLVSLGLYYGMGLDRSLLYEPKLDAMPLPKWASVGGGALGVAILIAVLLATPYSRSENIPMNLSEEHGMEISLLLEGDEHTIVAEAKPGAVILDGGGFGLPGSAVKNQVNRRPGYFQLKQRVSGWFTELRQTSRITVPAGQEAHVKVVVRSGKLTLNLDQVTGKQKWRIETGGEVSVTKSAAVDLQQSALKD